VVHSFLKSQVVYAKLIVNANINGNVAENVMENVADEVLMIEENTYILYIVKTVFSKMLNFFS
jgi:predicted transcriptional regulator